jgi:hypothetical protein
VLHARFDVTSLSVEGVEVPLRAAYLLVAEREVADRPEWECIAYGLDPTPLPQGRYLVTLTTQEGRRLEGQAVLVRSVEGAHVVRGDGPLSGLLADDLR